MDEGYIKHVSRFFFIQYSLFYFVGFILVCQVLFTLPVFVFFLICHLFS